MELNLRMNWWVGRSLDDGELDYAGQFETSCYIIVYYPPVIQHSVAMENGPSKVYHLRIQNGEFPLQTVTNNQRVSFFVLDLTKSLMVQR